LQRPLPYMSVRLHGVPALVFAPQRMVAKKSGTSSPSGIVRSSSAIPGEQYFQP